MFVGNDVTRIEETVPPPVWSRRQFWPADPGQLRAIRTEVRGWLDALDLPDETVSDLVYAVSEAATNAAEHAYRPRRSEDHVLVELRVDGGELCIDVSDSGCWRPADRAPADPSTGRGRGIVLMRGLVDTVRVATGPSGTRVSFVHPL
jgi:anti-sigma regulatory factor (Ser/Thr protein kinase)